MGIMEAFPYSFEYRDHINLETDPVPLFMGKIVEMHIIFARRERHPTPVWLKGNEKFRIKFLICLFEVKGLIA